MIQSIAKDVPLVMEVVNDPHELAAARVQWDRFQQNLAWFETQAAEVYRLHRGKCICVAGQQLFVADSPQEALRLAKAAHPDDDGRFTGYIPRKKTARIYANQRLVAPM